MEMELAFRTVKRSTTHKFASFYHNTPNMRKQIHYLYLIIDNVVNSFGRRTLV